MTSPSFEEDYFQEIYQGNYLYRNPPYKWRAFLGQILQQRRAGSLLDVGCALGLFLEQARRNFDCTGCDISCYALEQARGRLPETVHLFQGSLGELPTDRCFDVVTCFDVIEHVPDLERVWANLFDLLNADGLLVITVPVYDGPLGALVDHLDRDTSHVHREARYFWLRQVETHFHLRKYLGIWRYFFFNRYYLNVLSYPSRSLATAIMLIAEKP